MMMPHILVVDDEEDIRWALENILSSAGYIITCAESGSQALAQLHRNAYFIAFVDIKLPDQDGFAIAAHIFQFYPRTSVVLVSGYYNKEDDAIIEGLQKGIIMGFLSKPFNLHEVRALARQAFQEYEATSHV